jgi:hypothetical protein
MKKFLLITFLGLSIISVTRAQEYKVNKSSGKLVINLAGATVEGYNGNEIVFTKGTHEQENDPRAKGLRAINGNGSVDNTGLGISVKEKGTTIEVDQVASNDQGIKIMVPKGIIVFYNFHRLEAGDVHFKNMENEIEISTDYNSINLENISGPATIKTLYGSVKATFSDHIKGPISIASIYSMVDVSIPLTTKANIKLSSSHGDIFASSELKIEMKKNTEDEMVRYGNSVDGTLNGGGPEFKLTSEYGKIYLRHTK